MMRRLFAALCLSLGLSAGGAAAGECRDGTVFLRGDWGQARFSVTVADTEKLQARGLMFRRSLPRTEGMLFVYDPPRPVAFWMKNTLIPLDMIFFDAAGVVQLVHSNARPHDTTPIFGGNDIRAVLEINGGLAAQMGLTAGSEMRHPSIRAASAAWPC